MLADDFKSIDRRIRIVYVKENLNWSAAYIAVSIWRKIELLFGYLASIADFSFYYAGEFCSSGFEGLWESYVENYNLYRLIDKR